jgi:hypothetical protein
MCASNTNRQNKSPGISSGGLKGINKQKINKYKSTSPPKKIIKSNWGVPPKN